MASRQAAWAAEHRAAGLCVRDSRAAWKSNLCFECHLKMQFKKRGLLERVKKDKKAWAALVAGMFTRYNRIVQDEGFAVDALMAPEKVIAAAGFDWAKYKAKKQVLEVVAHFDDKAIRERFVKEGTDEVSPDSDG